MSSQSHISSQIVKSLARQAGFDLCGVCPAEPLERDSRRFRRWLAEGFHGQMDYLAREPERRTDPRLLMPGAKSIIALALNYYLPNHELRPGHGRVARYARGRDYHKVSEGKLKKLIAAICQADQNLESRRDFRAYVDYGPLLERAYAERAGLGFIGRNSLLITEEFGSWVLLSEIITTLELEPDEPDQKRHGSCGSCRRCLDHCPTGAILAPGVVDARKCISYLTIEQRGEIEAELRAQVGDNLFGCDICQEVCPFNHPDHRATPTTHGEFLPETGVGESLDLKSILEMATEEG
ncbi:MAG TPA: tRNA epoxyqueuosine(34) reductase QueG, partial [candidate division Zixibacteria bacterium]|nr:tRNA epoxyqueuosine(34) reductase QueG [candidate division Zixibacteria bacterium]